MLRSLASAALLLPAAAQAATPTPTPTAAAQTPAPTAPAARPTAARPPAIARTDLQRHDLSVAGHEAIQTRVDFAPGAIAPRHRHPGEEIVFILRGTLEYRLDGQPPVRLNPGQVLFIPAGQVHEVRNVGTVVASELATYVVEKGPPLITLVP
ncbi:MAG: cupin domain-containing protein [Sphingomonadaceae bacterium]|nr:cupin domain-containing protein [Sphingomonadaceae bacterium]